MSAPDTSKPSWKLASPTDAATQGLVVTGFGGLETGRALFLEIEAKTADGAWLRALAETAPATAAVPPAKTGAAPDTRAAALAFTWTGLARMGLDEDSLASFSRPFREGMFQEDRLRRLGDRREGRWCDTVVDKGPIWSGNTPLRPTKEPEEQLKTRLTVHALLLLYTRDETDAGRWKDEVEAALAPHQVKIVRTLPLVLDVERTGAKISREHFGFADGLSQPEPYDEGGAVTVGGARVDTNKDRVQGIPLGEVMIGYVNGHGEKAPGPVIPDEAGKAPEAGLVPHPQAEGYFDLGLNGSYMVVRELKQDVAEFWKSMDENTARIREQDPDHSAHVTADWLAERVVGRDREGHLLCPGGKLKPDADNMPRNDFYFYKDDPHGVGCPPGSHVRRAFPRDALAPNEGSRDSLLEAANNHRILRRGRKYGPKVDDYRTPDDKDRGLLFICLNTDIARQFEFVQQTWLLNSNFATLFDEMDPLLGPEGRMTIREEPLRRTVNVKTFVQFAGGEYFFLPSIPALRFLASR